MPYRILTINPGSTSTKIAVFDDEEPVFVYTLRHSTEETSKFSTVYEQFSFREKLILDVLKEKNIDLHSLDAIVGRGGLLKPIEGGTYAVNDNMLEDLKKGVQGFHISNLGAILAYETAKPLNIPSFTVDPVVVDEFEPVARISGTPEIERRSVFHALNQKAVAKRYARESNRKYEELNLIVAHLGSGVSVGVHKHGRVVDHNNALDGEGPFSPERTGGLPAGDLIRLCYSGKYTEAEMIKKITSQGGYVAYFNTADAKYIEEKAGEGDKKAKLIHDAMAYQISKEIGKCAAALKGKVDAIILTGGMAYGKALIDYIKDHVSFIAPIVVYPGEDEMLALAQGGLRVLRGEECAREYK